MPYIEQEARGRLKFQNNPKTEGELNYLLTLEYLNLVKELGESYTTYGKIRSAVSSLVFDLHALRTIPPANKFKIDYSLIEKRLRLACRTYFKTNKGIKTDEEILSDTVGALINSSDELYRRKVAPYEDSKKDQNGDVY